MSRRSSGAHDRGFTLVELVAVMAIVGILSVVAGPRFFSTERFAARGFAEDARVGLRYARALAVASGCAVGFSASATGYSVHRWLGGAGCNDLAGSRVPVARPGGGQYLGRAPTDVSVQAFDVVFDAIGRPRAGSDGTLLTAPSDFTVGVHHLTVEPETGLVR
ncbi:MAG: Tfp pilus assembly protein FimT/FimU [Gammaproteobacteria bacterium]